MDIDTSKPHIGRIYDCVLGGHHNYEADRQAAAQIQKVIPSYPKWARLNRWFLQLVASEWAERKQVRVLDIASGLPTQGHLNDFLADARILFSDSDPVSVAYGEGLLADRPNMRYCLADAREPEALLAQATALFGDERQVAIGCIGIAYFLDDTQLTALLRALYDWSAPGSTLAMSIIAPLEGARERLDALAAFFARMSGAQVHFRTLEQLAGLAAPWQIKRGEALQTWLDVPDLFSEQEVRELGALMAGAYLER